MDEVIINVTREHMERGTPGNSECCAAALAIKEAVGDMHVEVGENRIAVEYRVIETPEAVESFIGDYDLLSKGDDGKAVLPDGWEPFSFALPAIGGNQWMELCADCGDPYPGDDLDDLGWCPDCCRYQDEQEARP